MMVLRLLSDKDKAGSLRTATQAVRQGGVDARVFRVEPEAFQDVPGAPFAYWVSDAVREAFQRLPRFESEGRTAKQGLATGDDFRFARGWWEVCADEDQWHPFAKGGAYSTFYSDLCLVLNWADGGAEVTALAGSVIRNPDYYFRPGLTWSVATTSDMSTRFLVAGCIFSVGGSAGFVDADVATRLAALICLFNTRAFAHLVALFLGLAAEGRRNYHVGIIQSTPLPDLTDAQQSRLSSVALCSWSLKRSLDTIAETSHAFLLPALLRPRLGPYDPPVIEEDLAHIQDEIDDIAFDLYGFDKVDRAAMQQTPSTTAVDQETATSDKENTAAVDQDDGDDVAASSDAQGELLSWCVGIAFGRFDIRLATGERAVPPEPGPFDPLPAKSPGMLPNGAELFHAHEGVLVDDKGNPHDLPHVIEEVLEKVGMPVPGDVREWLQQDFFAFHLQHYSKSRRKAPIYWPLSTRSGDYTLWVYYPSLTDQTLYTAVNNFVEPKLKEVVTQLATLRTKGSKRTHEEEKKLEKLGDTEDELTDLRDTLLKIAPMYHPNQDDGVQITAAPLWPLFHHRPWQKLLKETWAKLEKGDYDWSHLAMHYWPDRVRAKCTTDKSLAIAHGLEDLYVEPETHEKTPRARRQ